MRQAKRNLKEWLVEFGVPEGRICMDGFDRKDTIEGIQYLMTIFDDTDLATMNLWLVHYISLKPSKSKIEVPAIQEI